MRPSAITEVMEPECSTAPEKIAHLFKKLERLYPLGDGPSKFSIRRLRLNGCRSRPGPRLLLRPIWLRSIWLRPIWLRPRRPRPIWPLWLAAAGLAFSLVLSPALAQDRVQTRAWPHPGFARIVFDWPAPVAYTARIEGASLIIDFERSLSSDFARMERFLPEYVSGASLSEDGKTLTVALKGAEPELLSVPVRVFPNNLILDDLRVYEVFVDSVFSFALEIFCCFVRRQRAIYFLFNNSDHFPN